MLNRFLRTTAVALLVCLIGANVRAQGRDGSLTASDRSDDPRLEHKVTIDSHRILLGRLLEQLSAQSGVTLRIDERDNLSGIPVLVVVKELPLGDAMNALWSLLYFPGGPWRWNVEGRKGGYVYTLAPTFAARNVSALLKGYGQAAYVNAVKEMMRLAQLTPEERRSQIRDLSVALMQSDDNIARNWTGADSFSENRWEGLRTLAESASPDQLANLLKPGNVLTLSVDKLSAAGRTFVQHYVDRGLNKQVNPDGTHSPGPDPKEVHFATAGAGSNDNAITPSLAVFLNNGGFSFVGGYALSSGFHNQLEKRWCATGDYPSRASEDAQIRSPKPGEQLPGAGDEFNQLDITRGVLKLAQAAPLQTMALLPEFPQGNDPGAPYDMTVKAFLVMLHKNGKLIHKWRNNVLLLCSPWRLTNEDVKIPYRLLKHLSRTGVYGSHFLSLDELAELLTSLSESQLNKADRQYAVVESAMRYVPLLAAYRENRDIGKASGAVCTPEVLDVVQKTVQLPSGHPANPGQAIRVRLVSTDEVRGSVPTRSTHIEFMNADRKWMPIPGLQFVQVGTAPVPAP
jgi:hypothetical protein